MCVPILEVVMRPRLQFLSIGPAVSDLQNLLNNTLVQALPKLVVDGKFGEKTLQRVRMYQQSRGLAADGVVGPMTWAALDGKTPPKPGATGSCLRPLGRRPKGSASGCPIKCSFGSAKSSLKISGPARPACIADCKQYVNIPTFGFCRSMANPVVSSLTMAAQATQALFIETRGGPDRAGALYTGARHRLDPGGSVRVSRESADYRQELDPDVCLWRPHHDRLTAWGGP